MATPTIEASPYGDKTVAVFGAPFTRTDFQHMEAMLGDLCMGGFTPIRWLERVGDHDQFRIVITTTGVVLP